jgi:hypothetical protein
MNNDTPPRGESGEEARDETMDVKERHHQQGAVGRGELVGCLGVCVGVCVLRKKWAGRAFD